ncbi:MAG: Fibronectin type domain protein [Pedosphaera sp.]|nr:Fibronectin type domain protein [Pedosphaera sp.]
MRNLFALVAGMLLLHLAALSASAQIRDGGIDPKNLGKGDWIYSITDATNKLGGHVSSVTNENSLMLFYKSQGVRYMMVKMASSGTLFNGCYSFPQFTTNFVNIAHTNGLLVFGYNRSYGQDLPGEVAIADFVFNRGGDGFVFDAEAEWETGAGQPWITNGPAQAWQLCSTVRSNWPNKFLAHAPFPIIALHSSFPYKEFGYWCDAVMPQIYHFSAAGLKGSPSACINWSDVNWKAWQSSLSSLPPTTINGLTVYWTNAIKPILPLQDVYGPIIAGGVICEGTAGAQPDEDVREFIDYCAADPHTQTAGGYKGINFWRNDLHGAVQWSYIKAGTSGDFPGIVNNIVIDDPNASMVGAWTPVKVFGATTTSPTYYGAVGLSGVDTNSFGTNYLVKSQGTGSAYVQFTPKIVTPGDYDVYEWHVNRPDASASVPFVINYNGGSTTATANQQINSGTWNLLGRFNFAAGTAGNIRVTDGFPEVGAVAVADGLKVVFVPPTNAPAAPSGLTATAVSSSQINLAWADNATNEINYLVARGTVTGGPYTNIATLSANATNYSSTNLAPGTTYYYVVQATNSAGASTNSAPAGATTAPIAPTAPSITSQPQDLSVTVGQDALFSVTASGSLPLRYQWRFSNTNIVGATNASYTRTSAQTNHAGAYQVVITNSAGAITSAPAALTVNFSLTATAGFGGTVSVTPNQAGYAPNASVTVTATPTYGFDFTGWSGSATGSSNPLSLTMNSNRAVTANFSGDVIESIVDNPSAAFAGSWTVGSATAGRYGPDYAFAFTVAGSSTASAVFKPTLTAANYNVYIWYTQGANRSTNAPWTIAYNGGTTNVSVNQQVNGGGWVLIASNLNFAAGNAGTVTLFNNTSDAGKVVMADAVRFLNTTVVSTPPAITNQPQDLSVKTGNTVLFSVGAAGTPPRSYQWKWNGNSVAGATASSYTRPNVQTNDGGYYSVVVSNAAGFATSTSALLTVTVPLPAQFQSIGLLPDQRVQVSLSGEVGTSYVLQRSSNLTTWLDVTNVMNTNGTVQFIDEAATNNSRFYRTRLGP